MMKAKETAMETTRILRIKRKRTEDPLDALLVAKESIDKRVKINQNALVFTFMESTSSTDHDSLKVLSSK